jgi:hypothetical protein
MNIVRIVALAIAALAASPSFAADGPKWSAWDDDLFARAATEKRFVNIPISANPQRSPAATASARSRPSPLRNCRPM